MVTVLFFGVILMFLIDFRSSQFPRIGLKEEKTIDKESCHFPRSGKCVGIYECYFFAELLARSPKPRPRPVIDAIRKDMCGFYRSPVGTAPKVCCREPLEEKSALINTESSNVDFSKHRNYKLLPNDLCGPIKNDFRITSGHSASIGEFPWMALLMFDMDDLIDFRCGGTVISKNYILTAAHCVVKTNIVGIRLGEYNVSSEIDCVRSYCAPPPRDFYIEDIIVHQLYNELTLEHDIALVRIANDLDFTKDEYEVIKPICLPATYLDLTGRTAIVSGWGVTEDGLRSDELRKASIPVKPTDYCKRLYQRYARVTDNQICAGGVLGRDTCGGDSGGPLKYVHFVNGSHRFIQYGIVSYGPRYCGTYNQPAIYTKVFNYMGWILDNLKD